MLRLCLVLSLVGEPLDLLVALAEPIDDVRELFRHAQLEAERAAPAIRLVLALA